MIHQIKFLKDVTIRGITEKPVSFGNHGINLSGKLFMPGSASRYNRVPGAVLCHGYGNDQTAFESSARTMAEEGVATLIFDFRGHGSSEGILDGSMVEDVIDAWDYLHNQTEVDHKRMGLIGHSMGAFSAIVAAGKVKKPKMLVALACPGEIKHAIMQNPNHIAYPWFRRLIALVMSISTRVSRLKVRVDFKKFLDSFPRMKISRVLAGLEDCSKLFVFCLNDNVTPYNRFLYSYASASEPKQILVTNGNHNTPLDSETLRSHWTDWAIRTLHGRHDY